MIRRKIQLIAGTTYTISLPKEWVKKNNLKEQNEVMMYEGDNNSLTISPEIIEKKDLEKFSINIDKYLENIDQILFAIYYLGVEDITIFSKKEFTKEVKARVRKTLTHMSGTEIAYEDKEKMVIKVLLDKTKVDTIQILYRISLIIDSTILNMLGEDVDIREIRINEAEIDRLYHLIAKMISISLRDTSILQSSNIKNVTIIPSYFLISKRLENLADNLANISEYISKKKIDYEHKKEILTFIKKELSRTISYLMSRPYEIFAKVAPEIKYKIRDQVSAISNKTISNLFEDAVRYVIDIEEEIVNMSFYNQLINDKVI